MFLPVRAAIEIGRVGASERRFDDLVGHLEQQRIDFLGCLHGGRPGALRRDHFEKGLRRLVEQVGVVRGAAHVARGPAAHEAKPQAVPERDVSQRSRDRPAVRKRHGQHRPVQTLD